MFDPIMRLTRMIRRLFDERAEELGLTYSRARLLSVLGHNEGATQTELACLLGIEAPTLKRQLDAIVKLGLAERRPIEGDGRKYAVYLTDRTPLEPLLGFRREVEAALSEGIEPEELLIARRVLARMAENAERLHRK